MVRFGKQCYNAAVTAILGSFLVLKYRDYTTTQPSSDFKLNEVFGKHNFNNDIDNIVATEYGHALTHREMKTLPNFKNGGIIVFYHIYKTGGSTVGKMLHELFQRDKLKHEQLFNHKNDSGTTSSNLSSNAAKASKLFFTMIRKHIDWERDCVTVMNIAQNQKKLMMLELHVEYPAPNFPSLVELAPTIQRWRAASKDRGIDFFAFTLIREPIPHALSFFNFFHVGHNEYRGPPTKSKHDYWNPFQPLKSSEQNFLRSYFVGNRQCRMYDSDPEAIAGAPADLVWNTTENQNSNDFFDACHFEKVHDALFEALDWVGTTENLQFETLPLLTKLAVNDPSIGRKNKPFKVFDKVEGIKGSLIAKGMKVADLSNKTFAKIYAQTNLDRKLYNDVVENFKLSDFGWNYTGK